jgi:hypothetical protein
MKFSSHQTIRSSLAKPESARSTMRTFSQRFSDQRNDSRHLSDCTQSGQRIPARKCRAADRLRRAGLLNRPTRHLPRGFSPRVAGPSGSSTIRSNGQLSGWILLPLALRAITRGRGPRVSGARITPPRNQGSVRAPLCMRLLPRVPGLGCLAYRASNVEEMISDHAEPDPTLHSVVTSDPDRVIAWRH